MATIAEKPRRKKKGPEATAALVALTENGMTRKDAGRVLGLSKAQVDAALDEAKLELQARAAEYARLHIQAATVAAEKGKAEPAQWALERLGVVQPPAPQPVQSGGGTVIKIGIALPGLSHAAGQIITVTPDGATTSEG